MVDGRSTTGFAPGRRLVAGILGATLIGALVAPAAAMAVGMIPHDDLITTTEDHATETGNVFDNDTLVARSAGYHVADSAPGVVTVASNGAFTYTPAANWSGTNQLVGWYLADPDLLDNSNEAITYVRVTVAPVNDLPVATPQTLTMNEDASLPITLAGTDVETAAGSLTVASHSTPAHGTLTGSGAGWTYTPEANYAGPDGFTFTVNDGTADSASATVSITVAPVNDLPVATPQTLNVNFETALPITLAGTDVETAAGSLTYQIVTQPIHGVLVGTGPATTYTPSHAFQGVDAFTFRVNDGTAWSTAATVSITVANDSIAPTVQAPTVAFGAGRVNETAPLQVSWSATDAGVGVSSYVVEQKVGAGAWTQIYAGTKTTITTSYPFGKDLQWRVKAKDLNANWSTFGESVVRKLTAYQGISNVSTTGSWTRVASRASSGTTYYYTTRSGKYKRLTFHGIAVAFVAPKTAAGGKVTVKIDTGSWSKSTRTTGPTVFGQIIKAKSLSGGSHTIRVSNAQDGRRANFDAFIVLR